MSLRIAVLKKIKCNLSLAELKLYFNALIKPIVLHGPYAWTMATAEILKRVFKSVKLVLF